MPSRLFTRAMKSQGSWLVALVSVPFIVSAIRILIDARHPFYVYGDAALIDLSTQNARHFHQVLGPYSRFGWNHPGPLYFYLLAPFYSLIHSPLRIYLAALCVNWLATAGAIVIAIRSLGARAAAPIAYVTAIFLFLLGPTFLTNPWNPAIVVLALLCCLIAAASKPSATSATVVVLTASMAIQTHISTASVAATVLGVVVFLTVVGRIFNKFSWLAASTSSTSNDTKRSVRDRMPSARSALAVLVTFAIAWIVPIHEQLTAPKGNLGQVYDFLQEGSAQHPLREITRFLSLASWPPFIPLLDLRFDPPVDNRLNLIVIELVGIAAALWAWRQRNRAALTFALFTTVGLPAAVLSLRRISGGIYVYLVWWAPLFAVSAVVALVSLATAEGSRLSRFVGRHTARARLIAPAIGSAIGILLIITSVAVPSEIPTPSRKDVQTAWATLQPTLTAKGTTVFFDIRDPEGSPMAAGLAVELQQVGRHYDVGPQWRRVYGLPITDESAAPSMTITIARTGSGNDIDDGRRTLRVKGEDALTLRF